MLWLYHRPGGGLLCASLRGLPVRKGQDFICFTRCLSGGARKDWIAGVVFILGNAVFSVSEKEYVWRCVSVKLGMCSLKSLVDNVPYLPVKGMSRYMLVLHKASVCNRSSALH